MWSDFENNIFILDWCGSHFLLFTVAVDNCYHLPPLVAAKVISFIPAFLLISGSHNWTMWTHVGMLWFTFRYGSCFSWGQTTCQKGWWGISGIWRSAIVTRRFQPSLPLMPFSAAALQKMKNHKRHLHRIPKYKALTLIYVFCFWYSII